MKKLLVFFLAVSLFTACNNDKGKDRYDRDRKSSDSRERDDYKRTDEPADDDRTERTDRNDDRKESENDRTRSNWTAADRSEFVTECASGAAGQGLTQGQADKYCNCMQQQLESILPDRFEAAKLTEADLNSPEMTKVAEDCMRRAQ